MIPLHWAVFAATAKLNCTAANGGAGNNPDECDTGLPTSPADGNQLHTLLQITIGIMAVITVLMIIISAMNIIYGEGDPQKVAKARSSIIYALVGLVVAITAEVIVTFVVGKF